MSFITCLKAHKTILSTRATAIQMQRKITRQMTTTIYRGKTTTISSSLRILMCGILPLQNNLTRRASGNRHRKGEKAPLPFNSKLKSRNSLLQSLYRPARNLLLHPFRTLTKSEIMINRGKSQKKKKKNPPLFWSFTIQMGSDPT